MSLRSKWLMYLSLLAGGLAYIALGIGYYDSLSLSTIPDRTRGIGLSPSENALLGGAMIGWLLSAIGVGLCIAALFYAGARIIKLLAGLPALLYFFAPFVAELARVVRVKYG